MFHQPLESTPELWAGVECTVNRVAETYFNQLAWNGHCRRLEDLERFATLGVRALRFPVLWELCESGDWTWPDAALARLRSLGIRTIIGLLHHGSGPRATDLLDSEFPEKFATYAETVARRYPWVEEFTPVNEPMTTARFSGLYGLWYPHGRSHPQFLRALVNQCRASILAMRAIRGVTPWARLIQTEDFGRTYSTPQLAELAGDLSERRWLTIDLLCGTLSRTGPMWRYLTRCGIEERELKWFEKNAFPPDVIGVNHYLTSDRFLDHDLSHYPPEQHASAGPFRFVDVEAVRACASCDVSAGGVLSDAWNRYRIPVAITEAHLGCTREEQVRWLAEIFSDARELQASGVDVRAVTAWSLLGAFNWNVLVTRDAGHYEPGVFDLRAHEPRATALVDVAKSFAAGGRPDHPVLDTPGWWRRSSRLWQNALKGRSDCAEPVGRARIDGSPRRIWILGSSGTVGRALVRACELRGLACRAIERRDLDLRLPAAIDRLLDAERPWAVINSAAFTDVDGAYRFEDACFLTNVLGPERLAQASAKHKIRLAAFSCDQVFDAELPRLHVEGDRKSPSNFFGAAKAHMESRILDACPGALIFRMGPVFGSPTDFLTRSLQMLKAGEEFCAMDNIVVSPVYDVDVANAVLDLLIDGETGVWHLSDGSAVPVQEFITRAARLARLSNDSLRIGSTSRCRALRSERGWLMPSLDFALDRYLASAGG
jgi:dTDP-4-dehydrorhamnose reductase